MELQSRVSVPLRSHNYLLQLSPFFPFYMVLPPLASLLPGCFALLCAAAATDAAAEFVSVDCAE